MVYPYLVIFAKILQHILAELIFFGVIFVCKSNQRNINQWFKTVKSVSLVNSMFIVMKYCTINDAIFWQSIIIYDRDHPTIAGGLYILERVVFTARHTVP